MKKTFLAILLCSLLACKGKNPTAGESESITNSYIIEKAKVTKPTLQLKGLETAYFAAGCFWCVEAIFESVKGVKEVYSGYSGGTEANPTYEQVGYGRTTHAEAVEVYYDPTIISFTALVQVFFGSHDPTQLNRQGPDRGAQYRSIAFYKNEKERNIIEGYIQALKDNKVYSNAIVTQVVAFDKFWKAEAYHQDFEKRNPDNSYVKAVSIPRLNRFKANFKTFLKEEENP